jgi:hypothetical protein
MSNNSYYQRNKEKWATKYNVFIHCDICDKDIKRDHFNSNHVKTEKHQRLVREKELKANEIDQLKEKLRNEILQEIQQKNQNQNQNP